MTFDFDPGVIADPVRFFGLVVTGANTTDRRYGLRVFDEADQLIATSALMTVSNTYAGNGLTFEDRFIGVSSDVAMGSVEIFSTNDFQLELDHI